VLDPVCWVRRQVSARRALWQRAAHMVGRPLLAISLGSRHVVVAEHFGRSHLSDLSVLRFRGHDRPSTRRPLFQPSAVASLELGHHRSHDLTGPTHIIHRHESGLDLAGACLSVSRAVEHASWSALSSFLFRGRRSRLPITTGQHSRGSRLCAQGIPTE